MIEDKDLRELFRVESAEHLQRIEAGLLQLERTPDDAALLEDVFREAHSLKGAARMLGLREIQNQAHLVESALGLARQDGQRLQPEVIAPQLALLDQIRRDVAQALGESHADPAAQASAAATPAPLASAPAPLPSLGPDFRIDTLRIESIRLDGLLQLAGELVVNQGRATDWTDELERLADACELRDSVPDEAAQRLTELGRQIRRLRSRMLGTGARMDGIVARIEREIRGLRLLPLATLLDLFPRMVRDLAADLGKAVALEVEGGAVVADKRIIEELKAPLTHLLRNALDHGIEPPDERRRLGKPETGTLQVRVSQSADALQLSVSDDGRGLDLAAIREQALRQRLVSAEQLAAMNEAQLQALILQPGFSTAPIITDLSGRGVGMDVVRAHVERLRGALRIESQAGAGLCVHLSLPVSITATRALLLREWGQTYAVPFDAVALVRRLRAADLHALEGRHGFEHEGQAIAVQRLGLLLGGAPPALTESEVHSCVVLRLGHERFGVLVDEVLDTEDLVVKPTQRPLVRVRNVLGLAILGSGEVCPVLNVHDLLRGLQRGGAAAQPAGSGAPDALQRKRVLLVEDSITTRMQERRILEAAGYAVTTAVDGVDAWGKLMLQAFDAVVSDIQMPRMSGLELAEKIRQHRRFAELPIVLVTSLASEDDRRRGMEVGADAYLSKTEFDQSQLLDSLARLA